MPKIDLYPLAKDAPRETLADATVIVVDLLRASTTIATALAAGAECVMPFAEIDDTLAAAGRFGRQNILLGGERGGRLIPGFDLGNSPSEYTPERVAGRRILFTTTNGARALHHARNARRILVGCALNCTAVARAAAVSDDVVVLCAGTDGLNAREDELAGGAIIHRLLKSFRNDFQLNAHAAAAREKWQQILGAAGMDVSGHFALQLHHTQGGRNLIDIGHIADLAECAQLNTLTVVPQLNPATGELRPA